MSSACGERRLELKRSRGALYQFPTNALLELPGRPHVVYQFKDYNTQLSGGAKQARIDIGFLFKAFETGQIGPKRLAKLHGGTPRQATIHEYLDWTVTAAEADADDELDFGGFRIVTLLPRLRPEWPTPGAHTTEAPKAHPALGAPRAPLPPLLVKGKPITAATIRAGPGFMEVPFVATHEGKRGRGYGRYMVEVIEDIARAAGIPHLLLCSTNEESVKSTWLHLGFSFTTDADLVRLRVQPSDLMHMANTVQMHKAVGPARKWRSLVVRHEELVQRLYLPVDRPPAGTRSYRVVPGTSAPLADGGDDADGGADHAVSQRQHGNGAAPWKSAPHRNGVASKR